MLNLEYNQINDYGIPIIVVGTKTQKRKHRKKRINKKWIKRYGYNYSSKLSNDQILIFPNQSYNNMYLIANTTIPVSTINNNGYVLFMSLKTYEKMKENKSSEVFNNEIRKIFNKK